MRFWLASAIVAALSTGIIEKTEANPGYYYHHRPHYCGYPGFHPGHYGYGGFGGGFYGFSTTTFYAGSFSQPPFGPYPWGVQYWQVAGGWGGPVGGWGGPAGGWGGPVGGWGGPVGGWGGPVGGWGGPVGGWGGPVGGWGGPVGGWAGPVGGWGVRPVGVLPFDPLNDYGTFDNYGHGSHRW